jgi:hypothetical protein
MSTTAVSADASARRWVGWVGHGLSALPIALMLFSASMKLLQKPEMAEAWRSTFGYPPGTLLPVGVLELVCVLLYATPRTAVLGAILLTGYLGAAVAAHVRIGDPFVMPIVVGVVVWAGLYLREPRLRALLPLRAG